MPTLLKEAKEGDKVARDELDIAAKKSIPNQVEEIEEK